MITHDVVLLLIGMAAGAAASIATGAAVRLALGTRRAGPAHEPPAAKPAAGTRDEHEVAVALAAVAMIARSR